MNEEDPDVYIVCIECGVKESVLKVKDEQYFLCNECLLESKMDLSIDSDESDDSIINTPVDLNISDF